MSAIISSDVQMKEILKATGYDCPQGMLGKTFIEAVGGGKWYCYKVKTSPYIGYYFKEETPDADTPCITVRATNDLALVLTSLRERYPYVISVTRKDGVLTVLYKNSETSSSTTSFNLYRSPDQDLDLV